METTKEKKQALTKLQNEVLDNYKKDKKGFIQRSVEQALIRSSNEKELDEVMDKLVENINNKEYIDMNNEVREAAREKLRKPERLRSAAEELRKPLQKVLDKNGEIDPEKFLNEDTAANFKALKAYNRAAKKAEMQQYEIPDMAGKKVKLRKIKKKVKPQETNKALEKIVTIDKLDAKHRPQMTGVYHDPRGYKVATDAHKMIAVKTDVGGKSGDIIDPKTGKKIDTNQKFPKWDAVIPIHDNTIEMRLSDIHSLSSQAKYIYTQHSMSIVQLQGAPQYFNPKLFDETVESMRKLGVEKVKINFCNENLAGAIVLRGESKKGEEVTGLIMPVMADMAESSLILE